MSRATQLRANFDSVAKRLANVLRTIPVRYESYEDSDIVVVAPEYFWGKPSSEQSAALVSIKREYEEWIELLRSVFRAGTEDIVSKIEDADEAFRKWLELQSNWSLRHDPTTNETSFRRETSAFEELLDILESASGSEVILVPDTNAIIANPDPASYAAIAGSAKFVFCLLPTVLSELDELKNLHRNPDFRDKANAVVTRIKGWRKQGSLRSGVTVAKTVTVRAIASEPDMKKSLSWLDPQNKDDRIIASVLEIQSSHPNEKVILVTGDINLANKAEAAAIHHSEL